VIFMSEVIPCYCSKCRSLGNLAHVAGSPGDVPLREFEAVFRCKKCNKEWSESFIIGSLLSGYSGRTRGKAEEPLLRWTYKILLLCINSVHVFFSKIQHRIMPPRL